MHERFGTPRLAALAILVTGCMPALPICGQEAPYFVTYDHQLEEPGSLEVSFNPTFGTQRGGADFVSSWFELEYGVKGWWTTELYLDGQKTARDSTVFTGFRWENRFRLLMQEHPINPVLYVEFEDINAADKTLLEVVGHDVEHDHAGPNAEAAREREREVETKLILSSAVGAWNLSENLIAEKNIAGGAWEFGYAIGASRPLALAARPEPCTFCPENFVVGMEVFGGLGDMRSLGLADTSHYLGPGGRLGAPQRSDAAAVARLRPQPQQPPRPPAPRRGVRDQAPGGPVMWRATGDRAVTSRLALIASTLAVCLAASLDGPTGTTPNRGFGLAGARAQARGLRNPFRGEADAVRAGRKLFVRYCATCHGEDARGRRATPALDSQRIAGAPEGDLFWFLTNGELRAGMPSWSRLPEARRWQLVTYVTTLPSQPSGAQPPN